MGELVRVDSINQIHEWLGLAKPKHPLVTVLPIDEKITSYDYGDTTYVFAFYQVSLKAGISGTITYGRNSYDFQEGTMVFTKPEQAMSFSGNEKTQSENGWVLLFHPDLIRKSPLASKIEQYSFFSYETHEALHLSDDEKRIISGVMEKIMLEYQQPIDRHSQKLIISNIELLLDYCTRYYDRQFYTRTNFNQDIVTSFETMLQEYFTSGQQLEQGLPTVKYCGETLNFSPNYLSDLLKKETGSNAQQHIQKFIIEKAKTALLGSNEPVSQIAYSLGFDYPQHFSKLFKANIGMSPAEYRKAN